MKTPFCFALFLRGNERNGMALRTGFIHEAIEDGLLCSFVLVALNEYVVYGFRAGDGWECQQGLWKMAWAWLGKHASCRGGYLVGCLGCQLHIGASMRLRIILWCQQVVISVYVNEKGSDSSVHVIYDSGKTCVIEWSTPSVLVVSWVTPSQGERERRSWSSSSIALPFLMSTNSPPFMSRTRGSFTILRHVLRSGKV